MAPHGSTRRYYAPLRLPAAPLGGFAPHSPHRYQRRPFVFVYPLSRLAGSQERPTSARALGLPVPLFFRSACSLETASSHKFPSYPLECMPRSYDPGGVLKARPHRRVRWFLHPFRVGPQSGSRGGCCASSTAAFRFWDGVGIPPRLRREVIPLATKTHFSRLYHAACILTTPGFAPPMGSPPVDARGFTTDLLARLWSGGTRTSVLTHWVATTSFWKLSPPSQGLGPLVIPQVCAAARKRRGALPTAASTTRVFLIREDVPKKLVLCM
jgi:hypothetical protein